MGQWNEHGNDDQWSTPFAGPSWSADPPPATEPALPPIRSAASHAETARETGNASLPPSRAMIAAQEGVRRDVMTSGSRSRPLPAPTTPHEGDNLPAPLIIPGNGRTDVARPTFRRQRPRSRAMQVALISIAGLMMLVILYAATPISAGASNKLNGFIAGSNLWNLPPTPTTTPTPTPKPTYNGGGGTGGGGGGVAPNPGAAAIMNDIRSVFGGYAQGALNVSRCESGYDPNAWNPISILGSHAEGVFQILYPITWRNTSQAGQSPYDSHANILAAHEIFVRDGYSWREWSCQP